LNGKTTLALAVVHDLTERKRAERELKESEHRYRALVDALPEAVFVHRGEELLFVNSAGLRFLGVKSIHALAGHPALSFVIEEDRAAFAERTRAILLDGGAMEPKETRVRRMDGSSFWVEMQCLRITYGGAPAVQGVFHDVTARKRREAADAARADRMQRQSEALLRFASRNDTDNSELAPALRTICVGAADVLAVDRVSIWLIDQVTHNLRCTEFHQRGVTRNWERVALPASRFSLYLETLRHQRVIESENVQDDPRLQEVAQGQLLAPAARSIIAAAIRISGELAGVVSFDQVAAARVWHPDEANFASGAADQIAQALLDSQREQALGDLRILAGELMRSQDEERRRIGRDLHDSTGQTLAALELDLARLEDRLRSLPAEQRDLLAECLRLASQCSAEIRTASYLLHPPLLDELGLVSALRWLADGLRSRGGIDVRLDLPNAIARLRPEEELTLFRIAQEALTNAQRHSNSPWVSLKLTTSSDTIRLEVEDGGQGIATSDEARSGTAAPPLGVGLTGMRERIRQVGGTFSFESTATGTRICAIMSIHPWPQARSA
jgi:PAS domain S-box-containing protein